MNKTHRGEKNSNKVNIIFKAVGGKKTRNVQDKKRHRKLFCFSV